MGGRIDFQAWLFVVLLSIVNSTFIETSLVIIITVVAASIPAGL